MDSKHFRDFVIGFRTSTLMVMGCFLVLLCTFSCTSGEVRKSSKVKTQDSLPFLHSVGVSTLISDSGVIRYHLVAEEWDIYTPKDQAATWKFVKGLLMLRLDESLDVDLYVQADTAYLHRQKIWELRGRVRIKNVQGTIFNTEELYWDLNEHEMWNHTHMTIITPERTLQGTEFRSNEQMTKYSVANSMGNFPVSDADEDAVEQSESQPKNNDIGSELVSTVPPAPKATMVQPALATPQHRTSGKTKVLAPAPTKFDFKKNE